MTDSITQVDLEKQWHDKFPSILSGLFAFYQCLCSIGVVGCELGSVLIDQFHSTVYAGFWAGLFLIAAWISQALAVSRCPTRRCATWTLILQCVSLFFAVCVIGFDAYFLIQPTACFFPLSSCNSTGSKRGVFYSKNNFNDVKIPLIQGQLAIVALMCVLFVSYIIMYTVTYIRLKRGKQSTVTFIDGTKGNVSTKTTFAPTTDENIGKSSSPSETDVRHPVKTDDSKTFIRTEFIDTDASDTTGNTTVSCPLSATDTKVSTKDYTTRSTFITKTTHAVSTNEWAVKSLPSSTVSTKDRSDENVVSTESTFRLTSDTLMEPVLPSAPGVSDLPKSDTSKNDNIFKKTTFVSTIDKEAIRPALPSTADTNTIPWMNDIEGASSVKRTPLSPADTDEKIFKPLPFTTIDTSVSTRVANTNVFDFTKPTAPQTWTAGEEVIRSLSRTNTCTNITPWLDNDENLTPVGQKTTQSSSLPRTNEVTYPFNDAIVPTTSVQPLFWSRWSISSDD